MSPGSPSHSAAFSMVRFVSVSDYTLLPPFFSRLCMCLFPLIFLINRSFLPPSCVYQLIYKITCLPALFSVGPAPSGIPISTSKVDSSGVFLMNYQLYFFINICIEVYFLDYCPPQPLAYCFDLSSVSVVTLWMFLHLDLFNFLLFPLCPALHLLKSR